VSSSRSECKKDIVGKRKAVTMKKNSRTALRGEKHRGNSLYIVKREKRSSLIRGEDGLRYFRSDQMPGQKKKTGNIDFKSNKGESTLGGDPVLLHRGKRPGREKERLGKTGARHLILQKGKKKQHHRPDLMEGKSSVNSKEKGKEKTGRRPPKPRKKEKEGGLTHAF